MFIATCSIRTLNSTTISKTPGHSKDTWAFVHIPNTLEIPSNERVRVRNAISIYELRVNGWTPCRRSYHIAIHRWSRSLTIYLSIYPCIHTECCINHGTALVFAAVWNRSDWILVPGRFRNLWRNEGIRVKFGFLHPSSRKCCRKCWF